MAFTFGERPDTRRLASPAPALGPRRGSYHDAAEIVRQTGFGLPPAANAAFERFDCIYRTLCGILYNFVPASGHPGGSISSGRIVEGLLFNAMEYDIGDPNRDDADLCSYAAGHKAMGLYAMWALRNEAVRIARPGLLPAERLQLRLEDLLGFRRNPTQATPLFKAHRARALDGHPAPNVPFVRLSTGASGVGVPASLGLALGALDRYRDDPPRVHIIEGEGGMTAGRVHESLALAASARLWNAVLHVDWNQASIDSNRVCRDGETPGDYVQWNPVELGLLHDWNVIAVGDGFDLPAVLAAQRFALELDTRQPTMIVYRTVKGWRYGIEGKASHGAGHACCSPEFYGFLSCFEQTFGSPFPHLTGKRSETEMEQHFFDCLLLIRQAMERDREMTDLIAGQVADAGERLRAKSRAPRGGAPSVGKAYGPEVDPAVPPGRLALAAGTKATLRGELGAALDHLNRLTGGGFVAAAADLLGSTSISKAGEGFPAGLFDAVANPDARLIATGGICEDAMGGLMAGLSAYGSHIGVSSSYAAFIAALEHIAARLHGIGQQAKRECSDEPYHPFIMVCAHAGIKTGEDGPTHADPQPLQLLQQNFPRGVCLTLTPWEPAEVWPLLAAALRARPAIIAPFVTRPTEVVPDRERLGLAPAAACVDGVYALRTADPAGPDYAGTLVLQGSGVTCAFVEEVLPELDRTGYAFNIYSIASAELFDLLPPGRQAEIFPEERAAEAIGITGFTLPTMYRWVTSHDGRARTLYPHRHGRFLGSGQAAKVMEEAGLDGPGQLAAIRAYADAFRRGRRH